MPALPKPSTFWLIVLLVASTQGALAQPCPPNAHALPLAVTGNLRTAHCWCNDGYEYIAGACVRTRQSPAQPKAPPSTAPPGRNINPIR
jgi:hypothetical protein